MIAIFPRDTRLKKYKCYTCLWGDNNPLEHPYEGDCATCKDRPNRDKDYSHYTEDFTPEQKAEVLKKESKKHNRKEEFDY